MIEPLVESRQVMYAINKVWIPFDSYLGPLCVSLGTVRMQLEILKHRGDKEAVGAI